MFAPITFRSLFTTLLTLELLQFIAHAQNDDYVGFKPFHFPKGRAENSTADEDVAEVFAFAFGNNKSTPLNVSLSTESGSGIVLSAFLCDNTRSRRQSVLPSFPDGSSPSAAADGILTLTASSDQFKSVLLRPDALPVSPDQCPPTNHSVENQSALLLLKVHSMANGSRGTLAVRRTDTAEKAPMAFTDEQGLDNELTKENGEWRLRKGQQPLVLPVYENCWGNCSNLVRYNVHMAVRQGIAELVLVQNCTSPPSMSNNSGGGGEQLLENRTVFLIDNFQPGEYLPLLDITFVENGTVNGTIMRGNRSQQSVMFPHCVWSSSAGPNDSLSLSSLGTIQLFISSTSSQSTIVTISQLRILNTQHLASTEGSSTSFSIGPLVGFVFFVLLLLALLFLFGLFAFLLWRHFLLQQRRMHCENGQTKEVPFEMDPMQSNGQQTATLSKKEESSAGKINARALEERAIGSGEGGGWM